MDDKTTWFDPGEQIALFRATIIGGLAHRPLDHGELAAELRALSEQRFRPPGAERTRTYSVATLERWLSAFRRNGLAGLARRPRGDAGRARRLDDEQRRLLLDIRAEYPSASASLVLETLETSGALPTASVSPQTLRRLYRQAGLPRRTRKALDGTLEPERQRLRWQASAICELWHADVCHALRVPTEPPMPVLVHGLLDDRSRYLVRLEVRTTERELDMLEILAHAAREHGVVPDVLYTDGGATYTGGLLPVVCARLGTHLRHPQPRDPAARGKIERLWRTMREQCVDHLRGARSLHDVYVRLIAWRERYHRAPHAGLMGHTPEQVWKEGLASPEHQRRRRIDEEALREAYRVRDTRRVRKDSTLSIDGALWEVEAAWLAGKTVTLERSWLAGGEPRVLFEGQRFALHPVDPRRNGRRRRQPMPKKPVLPAGPAAAMPPNPADTALDHLLGRRRNDQETR